MSGGPQVAFWKMVRGLTGPPLFVPRDQAIQIVAKELSDRQFALLAGRHPRNGVGERR